MSELEGKIKELLDSPDGMSRILETAQNLLGGDASAEEGGTQAISLEKAGDEQGFLEQLDPRVMSAAMQMMSEYRRSDDRRIQLLKAMRSYFKEADQVHITKAIQIVKLSKVAKQAFRSMREEDSFV